MTMQARWRRASGTNPEKREAILPRGAITSVPVTMAGNERRHRGVIAHAGRLRRGISGPASAGSSVGWVPPPDAITAFLDPEPLAASIWTACPEQEAAEP